MKEIIPDYSKNNQADQLKLKAVIFRDDLGSFFWWVDPLGYFNPLVLIHSIKPSLDCRVNHSFKPSLDCMANHSFKPLFQ